MTKPRTYRILVSSTYEDLKEHRQKVIDVIAKLDQVPVRMETFVAGPEAPLEECMRAVDESDAVVVIVAYCYGSVPSPQEGGDGEKSVTWHEVDRARDANKPVFAFLVDENVEWSGAKEQDRLKGADPNDYDSIGRAVQNLTEFRRHLSSEVMRATFGTPDSLASEAAASLAKWLLKQHSSAGIQAELDEVRNELVVKEAELNVARRKDPARVEQLEAEVERAREAADETAGRLIAMSRIESVYGAMENVRVDDLVEALALDQASFDAMLHSLSSGEYSSLVSYLAGC